MSTSVDPVDPVEPLLRVSSLRTGYGTLEAVSEASLQVMPGEIVALLGHNGAGKSTTLGAIAGVQETWSGSVEFDGVDVTGRPVSDRVARGICLIPEDGFVFPDLPVLENLEVAAHRHSREEFEDRLDEVHAFLPVLAERAQQPAGTLSGGERRMLSVGMAMMMDPRLLLLDEPSLGLAPVLVEQVMDLIHRLARDEDLSVLMVEQNVDQALHVAENVYVMRAGRIFLSESAEEMRRRDRWWDLF